MTASQNFKFDNLFIKIYKFTMLRFFFAFQIFSKNFNILNLHTISANAALANGQSIAASPHC